MHYVLHIQVCCVVLLGAAEYVFTAKEPHDQELFDKHVRNVESVLSPSLVEELRGGPRSNRTAVNVSSTAPRINGESSTDVNRMKSDIKIESQMNPYHYERSYHYSYPNNDASGMKQIAEDFHRPYFRPKYPYDSSSYRYFDPYNPYVTSTADRDADALSKLSAVNQDGKSRVNNQGSHIPNPSGSLPPQNAFASPEITYVFNQQQNQFPSNDFERFRHSVLNSKMLPSVDSGNSGSETSGAPALPVNGIQQQPYHSPVSNDQYPVGPSSAMHEPAAGSFQSFPPLRYSTSGSFQNFPQPRPELFQSLPLRKPSTDPFQSLAAPQTTVQQNGPYLPASFQGAFNRPGYQLPHNTYWPHSEQFNNLFRNNFTRSFPLSFAPPGAFHPNLNSHEYSADSSSSAGLAQDDSKMKQTSESGKSEYQPSYLESDKPEKASPTAAAAPSSKYEVKFLLPEHDDFVNVLGPRSLSQFTFTTKNYRF